MDRVESSSALFPYFFVGTFIEALFKAAGIKAPGPDFPTFS